MYRLDKIEFDIDAETGLCLSPKADFGAIFQTSGRLGCVFNLHSGTITAQLDRGEYRPENSHFPIAFFQVDERSLLVSATDWNRLDIIDPVKRTVLTERGPTICKQGERRPEHYLDYFHAQLVVSPASNWIADYGWIWSPWGGVVFAKLARRESMGV